jgi:hypothetical protein
MDGCLSGRMERERERASCVTFVSEGHCDVQMTEDMAWTRRT